MAKAKDKVLVHYFKVAVAQDPKSSDAARAEADLMDVKDVMSVDFVRSAMKTSGE